MAELGDQRKRGASFDLISRCFVSFLSFSLTHLALYMVPFFFPTSSLLVLPLLSVVVLFALAGVGRCCKRFLGVRDSAPSFVFFNILFIWGVYIGVIRQVTSSLMDFIINSQFLLLVTVTAEVHFLASTVGLCGMLANLAISTMLFSFLQVLWQVVFLAWHIYCVCFNIKTDEWINWKKYPEFHSVILPERGLTPNECEGLQIHTTRGFFGM